MNQSFGKEYKLCSKILIDKLFQEGKRVRNFPFSISYLQGDFQFSAPFQVLISVPKRQFKKAHDRNFVKRRIREIIRKNKEMITNHQQADNNKIVLSIVFNFNQVTTFVEMEQKLLHALKMLSSKLKQ